MWLGKSRVDGIGEKYTQNKQQRAPKVSPAFPSLRCLNGIIFCSGVGGQVDSSNVRPAAGPSKGEGGATTPLEAAETTDKSLVTGETHFPGCFWVGEAVYPGLYSACPGANCYDPGFGDREKGTLRSHQYKYCKRLDREWVQRKGGCK
jgi:hypothetical protein